MSQISLMSMANAI